MDRNDKTDDEEMEGEWTLRKASAWALDCLANPFAADVMDIMTPIITVKIGERDDMKNGLNSPDWLQQESTILALGAISGGCLLFMGEMMRSVYDYILRIIQTSDNPLLFSISAWMVGQCSEWVFDNLSNEEMDNLMSILLTRMLQPQRKVQLASSASVSVLIENGESKMERYFDQIIHTISECFKFYCV